MRQFYEREYLSDVTRLLAVHSSAEAKAKRALIATVAHLPHTDSAGLRVVLGCDIHRIAGVYA